MTSAYTPGGVSSCLISNTSQQASSTKQTKLQALFSAPSVLSSHILAIKPPKRLLDPTPENSNRDGDKKKSAVKKQKWESSLVLQRESSLRNANVPHPKNKKSNQNAPVDPVKSPPVEGEIIDDAVKLSSRRMNVECAKVRVESKNKGIVRNIRKTSSVQEDLRTVFVGNVALSVDKKKLLKLFKSCGKVQTVRIRSVPVANLKLPKKAVVIKKEFHSQRHNMNAYVVFEDTAAAINALKLNGTELDGLHIRVDLAPREKEHDHKKSVFVGNLPFDVEEESVRLHFEDCGGVVGVRVIRDRTTGLGKGFGYVMFEDASSVDLALTFSELFQGRVLRIQRSVKRPQSDTKQQGGQKKDFKTHHQSFSRKQPSKVQQASKHNGDATPVKKSKHGTSMGSGTRTDGPSNHGKLNASDAADGKKRKEVRKKKLKKKQREKAKSKLGAMLTGSKKSLSKTD